MEAEKVATDWEDGPWKSQKSVQGSYEPCKAIIVRRLTRQLCHKSAALVINLLEVANSFKAIAKVEKDTEEEKNMELRTSSGTGS